MRVENHAARLVPFDLSTLQVTADHPLRPIVATGGLVLPYTPSIDESISIAYEKGSDLIHSNQQFHAYRSTENRKITLGNIVFTCDTLENAQYALAAIHFFRSYSLMDFGKGRSGRPPSPMWFSAYGRFGFQQVPVLMQSVDIRWNQEYDLVGVPTGVTTTQDRNPVNVLLGTGQEAIAYLTDQEREVYYSHASTPEQGQALIDVNKKLESYKRAIAQQDALTASTFDFAGTGVNLTWIPMKVEIGGISLIEQHSPRYWKSFNLDDYKAGRMIAERETAAMSPMFGADGSIPLDKGFDLGNILPVPDIITEITTPVSNFLGAVGSVFDRFGGNEPKPVSRYYSNGRYTRGR